MEDNRFKKLGLYISTLKRDDMIFPYSSILAAPAYRVYIPFDMVLCAYEQDVSNDDEFLSIEKQNILF